LAGRFQKFHSSAIAWNQRVRKSVLVPGQTGFSMSWFARDKEKDRFYLLPGMGGRALRRKRKLILSWSIAAGLLVSLVVALILYAMSRGSLGK